MNNKKITCNAFFMNKNGDIIPVKYRHIQTVLDSPAKFGLTKQKILIEYIKSNETVGEEGKARNKVILDLLKKGFIRIRYNPKSACWRIQVHSVLNQKLKKNIISFCQRIKDSAISDLSEHPVNVDIEIHDTAEQSLYKGSLPDTISWLSQ